MATFSQLRKRRKKRKQKRVNKNRLKYLPKEGSSLIKNFIQEHGVHPHGKTAKAKDAAGVSKEI